MIIHWVSLYGLHRRPDGQLHAEGASARLRMLIPGERLRRRGHQVFYHCIPAAEVSDGRLVPGTLSENMRQRLAGDVIVLSKSANPVTEDLARLARARGMRVVFDICDHHFDNPLLDAHYQALIDLVDRLVVNTPAMAELVRARTNKPVDIVAEPYEGERLPPRFTPATDRLKLLWFGHERSFDGLEASLLALYDFSRRIPLEIHVVTHFNDRISEKLSQFQAVFGERIRLRRTEWSLEAMPAALEETDIVVLPVLAEQRKNVKSANRLVESLWAGRFAVAQPIAAYQDFAEWAWVGPDPKAGLEWALSHPDVVATRIEAAQTDIASRYAPEIVTDQWEKVLAA